MGRIFLVCFLFLMPIVVWAACPDGYTEYLGAESTDGMVKNANGKCVRLCDAGITSLNTSNGYKFDLFATKNTSPAIHVKYNGTTCYADLVSGTSDGTLNLKQGGTTYHAFPSSGDACPALYKISYSCGDGATGVPPETRYIGYGELYSPPFDAGTCKRPGYSITGWTIDTKFLTTGNLYGYDFQTDKTMVAQWTVNLYSGVYLCGGSEFSAEDLEGTYGGECWAYTQPCSTILGREVQEYKILDAWGNDTGEVVAPGDSFVWKWPSNLKLQVVWRYEE